MSCNKVVFKNQNKNRLHIHEPNKRSDINNVHKMTRKPNHKIIKCNKLIKNNITSKSITKFMPKTEAQENECRLERKRGK